MYSISQLLSELESNTQHTNTLYIDHELQSQILELYITLDKPVLDNHIVLIQLKDIMRYLSNTNYLITINPNTLSVPLCSLLHLFIDNDWIDADSTYLDLSHEQIDGHTNEPGSTLIIHLLLDVVIPILLHFFSDSSNVHTNIETDALIVKYLQRIVFAAFE